MESQPDADSVRRGDYSVLRGDSKRLKEKNEYGLSEADEVESSAEIAPESQGPNLWAGPLALLGALLLAALALAYLLCYPYQCPCGVNTHSLQETGFESGVVIGDAEVTEEPPPDYSLQSKQPPRPLPPRDCSPPPTRDYSYIAVDVHATRAHRGSDAAGRRAHDVRSTSINLNGWDDSKWTFTNKTNNHENGGAIEANERHFTHNVS